MRHRKLIGGGAAALLSTLVLAAGCAPPDAAKTGKAPRADVVLTGGGIYTVDAARAWAEAAAVRDGEIIAVGTDAEIGPYVGDGTRVVDLAGRMAIPGFHDAHIHPIDGGHMLLGCSLFGLLDREAILAKVADCARAADSEWLVGDNWDLSAFPDGNPHKSLLDAIEPERPVYLRAADGHSGWANTKALALAGITAATPDPDKGVIERDPATGEPTGTLRETARELIERLLPKPTFEQDVAALRAALAEIADAGITSFIDAATGLPHWRAYRHLAEAGELTARVTASLTYGVNAQHAGDDWESVLAQRDDYASARLDTGSVKLFIDGVLEGETGALVEPYTGMGEHRGVLNFDSAALKAAVTRFDAIGFQVHMHAIGDLAVREGLDALAAARAANGPFRRLHHIAHLQLIHPDDIPRFAELGVVANFQPLWAYPDGYIMGINLPVVGQARVDRMYPIGSVARSGAILVGGSDWNVSSVNPLEAIETAITRQDAAGLVEGTLNASERVDLATMVEAYTINGARLMGHDHLTGSIEPGKKADIVVLDRNIFSIPPAQLSEVSVDLVLLEGEAIFERQQAQGTR